jgi:hypothetical protein
LDMSFVDFFFCKNRNAKPIYKTVGVALTIVPVRDPWLFSGLEMASDPLQIVVFSYRPKYPSNYPLSTQWHAVMQAHTWSLPLTIFSLRRV